MKQSAKMEIGIYSLLVVIIIVFIIFGIKGLLGDNSLSKNKSYTTAIISDFYGIRQADYFHYYFTVNNTIYKGSGKSYPKTDTLKIGDKIDIVYDRTNPDVTWTVRGYENKNPYWLEITLFMGLIVWLFYFRLKK